MKKEDIGTAQLAYSLYGSEKSLVLIVIETALCGCSGEWWHIAAELGVDYQVLAYDRAGYGESSVSKLARTPENIAIELEALLIKLNLSHKQLIFIGHSQGGLYAKQHARRNPGNTMGMILLDPLTTADEEFRKRLTPEEYKFSGVEKTQAFKMGIVICSLKLGFLFKPLLRKSPPFYYYQSFSPEAESYILNSLTQAKHYRTAVEEYLLSHREEHIRHLRDNHEFPNIPIFLITHDSVIAIEEALKYTGSSKETAEKVENIWQEIMKTYLSLSQKTKWINASKSSHYIHLSEPELIKQSLAELDKTDFTS